MWSPQVIPPEHAMRFRSGRQCLDFVHTGQDEHMRELLHRREDVAFFLAAILDVREVTATSANLSTVRSLRTAIDNSVRRAMKGQTPSGADVSVINEHASHPPVVPELTPASRSVVHRATCQQVLSTLACDAIDLLSSELAHRIRVCAADDCGLFLLDTSRPNQRRWCSMELCGNRSKIRAFRSRPAGA